MSEHEYYEILLEQTANCDCDKCIYGCDGGCHIECNKSYEDYMREERGWLDSIGF